MWEIKEDICKFKKKKELDDISPQEPSCIDIPVGVALFYLVVFITERDFIFVYSLDNGFFKMI